MSHHTTMFKSLLVVAIFFVPCSCYPPAMDATAAIPGNDSDRLALLRFKNEISNDPLAGLMSWNDTLNFCDWNGVLCDRRRQRVISLNLTSLQLAGFISPYITNLTHLIQLDLSHNVFRGTLPREVGRLSHLQHLDLLDNYITGEIPASLSDCKDLRFLRLRFNSLVGIIPPELTSLSKLEALDLYSNNLTGTIPPSIGNLSSLVALSIALNGLRGSFPAEVGRIQSLQKLNFRGNYISGTIPPELTNLSSLAYFLFAQNELHGSLPANVGLALPKLLQFAGGLNHITGPIPASLSNASELEILDFADNNLNGPITVTFGSLPKLVRLNFGDNSLENAKNDGMAFITSAANCTSLEVFAFDSNMLTGVLPDSIANLSSKLTILTLGTNKLSGTFPAGIDNYLNLSLFSLENNRFTGRIPSTLGRLRLLQELFLYNNGFSGEIPPSMGNLTQLIKLELAGNGLTGNIPPSLGSCRHLEVLDLSRNRLDGAIPPGILRISSLSISVDLSENRLTGPIPDEVQNLQSLGKLDLSGNRLSGKLPAALGRCIGLESLMLGRNLFQGAIPLFLGALSGIRELDLSRNNLSSAIPGFLEKLSSLRHLNLSFNSLGGEVPVRGVFGNASAFSVVGNHELCGGIAGLRLPPCSAQTSTKHQNTAAIVSLIAVAIAALFLFVVAVYIAVRRFIAKSKRRKLSAVSCPDSEAGPAGHVQVSYAEILRATDEFSQSNLIGEGSYGSVYKGEGICNEEIVAVKVLRTQGQTHAFEMFRYECESLKDIRHRNLVKIITSCSSVDFRGREFKALLYDYMPNGNLHGWLHLVQSGRKLTLSERLDIAIDVASALEYLHLHCYRTIVHCNLKPSNVLLDGDMTAHLGDFGLARFLSGDCSRDQNMSSRAKGSLGYLAPEYARGGGASTAGDVYSYGILMLEIFTGRRPTDPMFMDGLTLPGFASSTLPGFASSAFPDRVSEIVDPALVAEERDADEVSGGEVKGDKCAAGGVLECLVSVIRIAIICSKERPGERMNMQQVSMALRTTRDSFIGVHFRGQKREGNGRLEDEDPLVAFCG